MESCFWGLVLQPDKMYEQTVETSFHVSMACLEGTAANPKITNVYVEVGNEEFLICNLGSQTINANLDLNFLEGEKIGFRISGPGVVHLTGYLRPDASFDSDDEMEEDEDDIPELVNGLKGKRKLEKGALPGSPAKKTKVTDKESEIAKAKKVKNALSAKDEESSEDEDTSDDGILDFTENFAEEEDSEEEDDDDDSVEEEESDEEANASDDDIMEISPKKTAKATITNGKSPKEKLKSSHKAEEKTPNKSSNPNTPKSNAKPKQQGTPKSPKSFSKNGIQCEEVKVGSGAEVKRGKMIGMYYDGRLKSNNKRFDSTLSGKPFKFRLGAGEVIKGWDIGLEGMKVGGKRRVTIPPKFAYGSQGAPPDIPPNSALVFDVECKFVN